MLSALSLVINGRANLRAPGDELGVLPGAGLGEGMPNLDTPKLLALLAMLAAACAAATAAAAAALSVGVAGTTFAGSACRAECKVEELVAGVWEAWARSGKGGGVCSAAPVRLAELCHADLLGAGVWAASTRSEITSESKCAFCKEMPPDSPPDPAASRLPATASFA